jgi:hypothetical protein
MRKALAATVVIAVAFLIGIVVQREGIPGAVRAALLDRQSTEDQVVSNGVALQCEVPQPSLRLNIVGDSRGPTQKEKFLILERIAEQPPDALLHLGDMVYGAHQSFWDVFDGEEGRLLLQPGEGPASRMQFLPVIGNHEYSYRGIDGMDPDHALDGYRSHFPFLRGAEWYSYTCGPVRILVLNSNPAAGTDLAAETSPQRRWLEAQLRMPDDRFLIVAMHHPLVTGMTDQILPTWTARNLFIGGDGRTKPALVLAGHVHNYERHVVDGVQFVTSGGGGAPPHVFERSADDQFKLAGPQYHYLDVRVDADRLQGAMVRYDATQGGFVVGDEFTVTRTPPTSASR